MEKKQRRWDVKTFTYKGQTKTLQEWEEETGIKRTTLIKRYVSGWDIEDIIETEVNMHGYARHYLYRRWYSMKNRCFNPNDKDYPNYGGRGITVCDRWKGNSPENYIEDIEKFLGKRPSNSHTLDRIDNNGDYKIDNVRWASKSEQIVNQRHVPSNTGEKNISLNNSGRYVVSIRRDTYRVFSVPLDNIERAIELRDYYYDLYENNKEDWQRICKEKDYIRE